MLLVQLSESLVSSNINELCYKEEKSTCIPRFDFKKMSKNRYSHDKQEETGIILIG